MMVHGMPPGERRDVGELSVRRREGEKMASMMKVIVGLEGSRCHHDGRPRPQGSRGKLREACT